MKTLFCGFCFLIFGFFSIYAQPDELNNGTYNILDFPVNIRSNPNTSSKIIGRLNLHDEIEIIGRTGIEQTIGGIQQFWYKIRFNNITGYIFGGYIAFERFIFRHNNNSTYYIYYRRHNHTGVINSSDDLFVFLNDRRLFINNDDYYLCYAFKKAETIYIKLALSWDGGSLETPVDIYCIEPNGNIRFYARIWQTFSIVGSNFDTDSLEEETEEDFRAKHYPMKKMIQ